MKYLPGGRLHFLEVCFAALLVLTSNASAQTKRTLEGKVAGTTGEAIPSRFVSVTLFSDEQILKIQPDEEGNFKFDGVPLHPRFLEASSEGFISDSIPLTGQLAERNPALKLGVGYGNGCTPIYARPLPSYEKRTDTVQLEGRTLDSSEAPLADTTLTLVQFDLDSPLRNGLNWSYGTPMNLRVFKEKVVGEVRVNQNGEFQFSDIEPGWYTLKAARDGYSAQLAKFWVARENLTKLSPIHLFMNKLEGFHEPCAPGGVANPPLGQLGHADHSPTDESGQKNSGEPRPGK